MAKKKRGAAHGGHGWFVTFADLMALLLSFFVMLVAFSNQDQQKLKVVAGSMREAFGVQTESRFSGVVETEGLATRTRLKQTQQNPDEAKNPVIPDMVERGKLDGARLKIDREFALASASLRQALQDLPELTEMSKHIMFEETKEGLNLEIIDQDGRSMFPDGSKEPYERTRLLIQKLDRANAVRKILQKEGLPAAHFFMVAGKADTQPLFPDDPSLAANRRVTITLMREDPPLPPNLKP